MLFIDEEFLRFFCLLIIKNQYENIPHVASAQEVPTDPTAYYKDYWQYASYYGEAAARLYYGAWSPPVGTAPPAGVVIPADPSTGAVAGQEEGSASADSSQQQQQQQQQQSDSGNNDSNNNGSSSGDGQQATADAAIVDPAVDYSIIILNLSVNLFSSLYLGRCGCLGSLCEAGEFRLIIIFIFTQFI